MNTSGNDWLESARGAPKEDVWINSSCSQCYSACGIKVHRVNGTVVKIEGNPDFPHNLGRVCAKGNAGLISLYDPSRVKFPMRRTNPEKGIEVDPKWVEIGWDEALDLVAEKLRQTREKNPNLMGMCNFDTNAFPFSVTWGVAYGTRNLSWTSAGYFCGAGLHLATYLTNASFHMEVDLDRCNYAILFGSQLGFGVGHCPNINTQHMSDARIRGLHLVVVDPVCSQAASKADEWIPIRPGTDGALALAMLNVILNDLSIYDREFIEKHTNGPYLVGENGRYVRDRETGKPLVWDASASRAVRYDEGGRGQAAVEGSYRAGGVECRPSFQVLKEHVKKYTPERVSEVTTIPAATIKRIAEEYAKAVSIGATIVLEGKTFPFRPAAVHQYRGAYSHKHSTHHALAIQLLNIVVGNVYMPGGHLGMSPNGPWWKAGEGVDGMLVASRETQMGAPPYRFLDTKPSPPKSHHLDEMFPIGFSTSPAVEIACREHDKFGLPPLEVLVHCRGNVMMSTTAPEEMAKALKEIKFIVSFGNYLDETMQFADVVFPDAHYLERLDAATNEAYTNQSPTTGQWYWGLRQPVVKPPFKAPHWVESLIELADRAGFLEDYNTILKANFSRRTPVKIDASVKHTMEEWTDAWCRAKTADDSKGLDWFRENGFVKMKRKIEEIFPWENIPHRIPLYFEHFLTAKDHIEEVTKTMGLEWDTTDYTPLMEWFPCPSFDAKPGGYDLFVVNYTVPFNQYSITPQNPWLAEITERHPYAQRIMINKATADRLQLEDGATVWVETPAGRKVKGKIKATECIHPEVVAISGVFGAWSDGKPIAKGKGPHFNSLLPSGLKYIDMISGSADACERVKVYRA